MVTLPGLALTEKNSDIIQSFRSQGRTHDAPLDIWGGGGGGARVFVGPQQTETNPVNTCYTCML